MPQINFGGAKGDRTPDLYTASVALSQLSYSPKNILILVIIIYFYINTIVILCNFIIINEWDIVINIYFVISYYVLIFFINFK